VGGSVIDGTGAQPRPATVLIRGSFIEAVGSDLEVPRGSEVMDITGMTDFRDRVARGEAVGPRILTSGPYFDHDPSVVGWIEGVSSAEEAIAKFEAWKDRIDVVKVYSSITENELGALAQAAHAEGLKMTGHLGGPVPTLRAIELGIDGLEHGIFAIAEITDAGQADPNFEPPTDDWLEYLSPDLQEMMTQMPAYLDEEGSACLDRALSKQLVFIRRVHESGGMVLAGTDPVSPKVVPGYGLHAEMANFVRAGLGPLEAISNVTMGAATILDLDDQIGSVEAGKRADLVVVRGDPASDISQIGNTVWVFKGGERYDPAALRESAKGRISLPAG
jgi:imidazolonepropionase-like amidohydrolase